MSEVNVQKSAGCNENKINVKPVPVNPVVIENSYRGIDYNVLKHKPQIEGNELIGNKTAKELLGFDKTDMDATVLVAQGAEEVANAANEKAQNAVDIANAAKETADGIDAKATDALTNSNTAVNTANSAKQTAEAVDGKATQALTNSATALETANQAKATADSFQGQITTLHNDVDDLGDQVAAIEGKIPAEATTANQLADKEFVTTITDELAADITALNADIQQINLIKWVQALPATGETKYLYAVPRNEVYKDGKKIAVLYLWDGTEWRGAGGISIYPGAGIDGIKGDYCTTHGIIDAPNGILTNPSGMEVVLKQGVVLQLAGQDIKTTISGDMAHTITSTADCDLFYVSGTTSLMEVAEIVWSRIEPDNGQTGVLAWWNPNNKKWKFKSNDTGNVWAEAVATPIAHIHTNGTTITRIDHIGYRILDDEVYALKSNAVAKAGDTITGDLNILGTKAVTFGTGDDLYYIKKISDGTFVLYNKNGKGLFLQKEDAHAPFYWNGTNAFRLLTTADLPGSAGSVGFPNYDAVINLDSADGVKKQYIAPSDGWISYTLWERTNTTVIWSQIDTPGKGAVVWVNGNRISEVANWGEYVHYVTSHLFHPVKKGDIIDYFIVSKGFMYFYPMK